MIWFATPSRFGSSSIYLYTLWVNFISFFINCTALQSVKNGFKKSQPMFHITIIIHTEYFQCVYLISYLLLVTLLENRTKTSVQAYLRQVGPFSDGSGTDVNKLSQCFMKFIRRKTFSNIRKMAYLFQYVSETITS